jgi:hypothetical protein
MTDETRDPITPRGEDDRRQTVDPSESPAPSSPEPDPDAVRKGKETLERVKPY